MDAQLLQSKIAAIPAPIREWYSSEKLINLITSINAQFKIDKGHQSIIPRLLLRLAIKDIAPDSFAGGLAVELTLDKNTALAASAEIKKSILAPIQKDLLAYGIDISLLDKFQAPPVQPKTLNEIKPPTPAVAAPQIISQTYTAAPNLGTTSLASNKNVAAPTPQPPKPSNDAGWSRRAPQGPTVKLGAITPQVPVPPPSSATSQSTASSKPSSPASPTAPSSMPLPTPPPVSPQSIRSVSEFDRLDAANRFAGSSMSPIPSAAAAPKPTAGANVPTSGPAPMILHQQPSMPTQNTPDFKVTAPVKDQMIGTPSIAAAPSSKPAMLEFGTDPSAPAPKAVHYTEYQPPAPPRPAPNNAPRQVTEITAPQAVPVPIPPAPPMAPSPQNGGSAQPTQSKQPAMPQSKVIVKDFL